MLNIEEKQMSNLTPLARNLRVNQTDAEKRLWSKLRNRQLMGFKFKRQVAIESYIADFVCFECSLIIELDGGHHAEQVAQDGERTEMLESGRFLVKRYWNNEVLQNTDGVLQNILETLSTLTPTLSLREREKGVPA